MSLRSQLERAVIITVGRLSRHIAIPADIAAKTYEYYLSHIKRLVRDLYRGDIAEGDFVTDMADLIEAQLTRAWHEGMRTNDLDPQQDMEDEWAQQLEEIILSEFDYVDQFAADIVSAAENQEPWDPLLSRAEVWANRYNDVVNQAVIATKEQKLIWIYGDTDHCDTCLRLNGIVAWVHEWDEAGVRPQNPPNGKLECGGWHCQCQLIPTGNRHTRNAMDEILRIIK